MPRFAKILSSGSPAEVTSITASELPNIVGNDQHSLIFADTGGKFYSSSKIYLTGSNELVLEDVTLSTFTITASGIPDELTNESSILFINEDGGFETTSSLRYLSSGNKIAFDGVFSGSFTGNGSGITGVIGNTAFPLTNGAGIGSSSFDSSNPNFSWNGSEALTIAVITASDGGIVYNSSGLQLDPDLSGQGLEWETQYNKLKIQLNGSSNGTSGLKLTTDGLAISDNIAGDGLSLTGGSMSIDLTTNSGLAFSSGELKLADSLPGDGLQYSTANSVLEIKPSEVITSSAEITFKTGSNNLTLSVSSGGTVTSVAQGFSAKLIDQPQITYDVSDNLTGDFTITGDFTAQSDVIISGSSLIVQAETSIADPFPLVNDGGFDQGGFLVEASVIKGAFLIFDHVKNVWALSNDNITHGTTNHDITGSNYAILASTRLVDDTTANIVGTTPLFGNSTGTRVGQMIVQQNPPTKESPLFIYA